MSMRIVVGASALLTLAPWGAVQAQADLSALQRFYQEARFAEFDAAVARTPERALSPLDFSRFQQLRGFAALARRDSLGARRYFLQAIRPGGGVPADSMLHAPGRRRLFEALRLGAPVVATLRPADGEWRPFTQPLRLTALTSPDGDGTGDTRVEAMWCQRTTWQVVGGWRCEREDVPRASGRPGEPLALSVADWTGAQQAPPSGTYFVPTSTTRGDYQVEQLWRIALETEAPFGLRIPQEPRLDLAPEQKTVHGWSAHPVAGPFSLLVFGGALAGAIALNRQTEGSGDACRPEDKCSAVVGLVIGALVSFIWAVGTASASKLVTDGAAVRENERRRRAHEAEVARVRQRVEEMRMRTVSRVVRVERVQ
jgi:hypothetical protein